MRSTLIAAAFAAGALAVPYAEKRANAPPAYDSPSPEGYGTSPEVPDYGNVEIDYDVVYVTQVVTVVGGGDIPAPTPEVKHYGHKHNKKPVTTPQEPAPADTPPTPKEPAPADNPPTSYEPPAPSTPEAPPTGNGACSLPAPASDSYADVCLYQHNLHRCNHSAVALVWSESLAATAQKIADTCVYAHDTEMDGGGYGQNIAAGVEPAKIASVITEMFYNPEQCAYSDAGNYGKSEVDMALFTTWGHFTQIVWKGTTHVGCATSQNCQSLANTGSGVAPYFTVCNYKNPGNYAGKYGENVQDPGGKLPTVYADAAEKALEGLLSY